MSDYLYLYRGGKMDRSPEEMEKTMQKWIAWFNDLGATGKLKAGGDPLEPTGKVVTKRATVTDGPFAEAKDLVGGYSIVSAKDIDEAAKLASGCPIFDVGGSVEVRPIMQMSM